jgi:hypothetical protein
VVALAGKSYRCACPCGRCAPADKSAVVPPIPAVRNARPKRLSRVVCGHLHRVQLRSLSVQDRNVTRCAKLK